LQTNFNYMFANSHVKFVKKQNNEVGHGLVRMVHFLVSFHTFIDIPTSNSYVE